MTNLIYYYLAISIAIIYSHSEILEKAKFSQMVISISSMLLKNSMISWGRIWDFFKGFGLSVISHKVPEEHCQPPPLFLIFNLFQNKLGGHLSRGSDYVILGNR